ncbi:MAG: hypothetical protein HGA85_07855 [Nanoarchaeota archaeon]|nr:hypothetical protein [Nanoarchaeota archaeon]
MSTLADAVNISNDKYNFMHLVSKGISFPFLNPYYGRDMWNMIRPDVCCQKEFTDRYLRYGIYHVQKMSRVPDIETILYMLNPEKRKTIMRDNAENIRRSSDLVEFSYT